MITNLIAFLFPGKLFFIYLMFITIDAKTATTTKGCAVPSGIGHRDINILR